MDDYQIAKAYWDSVYAGETAEAVSGRAFQDETFDRLLRAGLSDARDVLDYGCGDGWGLFEMYFTCAFERGLGIDAAENGVRLANACAEKSGLSEKLRFVRGDVDLLGRDAFDFILTVNLLDVIPADACDSILRALRDALRPGRRMLVCLNPEFTEAELTSWLGMEKRNGYFYKNGVLRARIQKPDVWKTLFARYFEVEEIARFALTERERTHPRVAYLLRKT